MAERKTKEKKEAKERYVEGIGRRKKAVARVRIYEKKTGVEINGKSLESYFPTTRLQRRAMAAIDGAKATDKVGVTARVTGGGPSGQADAMRLGLARALILKNPDLRKRFKRLGLLTRDARMVERKKYGLKKARRAPQWKKR